MRGRAGNEPAPSLTHPRPGCLGEKLVRIGGFRLCCDAGDGRLGRLREAYRDAPNLDEWGRRAMAEPAPDAGTGD
jgi:hypothetical protein